MCIRDRLRRYRRLKTEAVSEVAYIIRRKYMNYQKYTKMYHPVHLEHRDWPDREITHAPIWCSVDLRDGNQALYSPMTIDEKIEFFQYLVKLGFKEIEVGFPAASHTEFDFIRRLIDEKLIPDDVTIQVLTQARKHIIAKTRCV